MKIIETDRLMLRTWQDADADDYYRINQDGRVLEHLPGPLTMDEVRAFMQKMNAQWNHHGFTLWAAEEKSSGKLIGFIGLSRWNGPFGEMVEIGWRLGSEFWGNGYATEGAKAALEYGFERCGLNEIVAFTVPANLRSQRVMEKIGMQRDHACDFAHPALSADHRLSAHILYRVFAQR